MRIFILLILLSFQSITSDMIVLKNGQVLIGRYLSEDNKKINFQVFKETKSIPKSEIKSFELGYSGVPVCYQLHNKWAQSCGDVIHLLDKNKMILGKGEGLLDKEELLIKDLKQISLKKSKKDERFFYILRSGIEITIKAKGSYLKGEIISVNFENMKFKTKDGPQTFLEEDVDEVSWEGKQKASMSFLRYTIPGLFQFQEGKRFKGIFIGLLFFGFAGGIGSEYSAARKALASDVDFILINNSIFIGSNIFPNKEYEKHIRGMNLAIGGLSLVYLFHSYEVYSFVSSKGVKASIHLQPPALNSQTFQNGLESNNRSAGIEFRLTYSF